MARVTATEVKQIIDLDTKTVTDAKIEVFIDTANLMIANVFAATDHSEATLTKIELFLSAHLLHALDPRATSEKAGEVAVKYAGQFGKGLDATTYGQTVAALDTTGKLASSFEEKKNASITLLEYDLTES